MSKQNDYKHMTDEDLLAIKNRCEQATAAPWKAYIEGRDFLGGDNVIKTGAEDLYLTPGASVADHDFIANARQDIPKLIAEIERLWKLLLD